MEEQERPKTLWDYLLMALCVFIMVLLLLMTSSSFTPDFREVLHAFRSTEALAASGIGYLHGHVL